MRTKIVIWVLLSASPLLAQANRKIFIITDAEGVAGICRQSQTDPHNSEMQQLLTGETNAAVEGFLDGGADEVLVWDGHDDSQTLSTLTIHRRAKLMRGNPGYTELMDRGFSGVAFIGQHSR